MLVHLQIIQPKIYSWQFHLIMWPETAVYFPKMSSLAARPGCAFRHM
jgi:hypothetical protein